MLDIFIDNYKIPGYCRTTSPSYATKAWHTLRYRSAAAGICMTANEKRLASFRDIHKGKRVIILGNGPSLNFCDLRPLKSEITFGVNSIFLNYEKMSFHPTYYVVEDMLVAEDRAEQIIAYKGPIKLFGNYLKYALSPSTDATWLNVMMRYDEYPGFPHFSRDALRILWVGGTVTYLCLQLAYYMGFSEVYLVGFDHSYTIPSDAQRTDTRIMSTGYDPNHFDNSYFGKGYRWHDPRVDRMERAYVTAKKVFESDGRKIINATSGGQLEVFTRVPYASLFS